MDIRKIERVVRAGRLRRPGDRGELARWAGIYAGLHLPARGVCERHQTPLDYLEHVFFEVEGEAVVWACRGGGKTKVGAVATLLDMLFKPGVQVRILGGSREQSEKMYAYLCDMVKGRFEDLVVGRITKKGFALSNGSRVEILAQSLKAVRGTRVQKLRCDEVELFDEEVWKAAQLTTRSMTSGQSSVGSGQNAERRKTKDERRKEGEVEGVQGGSDGTGGTGLSADKPVAPAEGLVRGSVEVFSTMHVVGGLMQKIVGARETQNAKLETQNGDGAARKVFSWCVWDVMARCHPRRKCEGCVLWDGCGGRAKEADGFVPVADVIAMRKRVSAAVWESEMLCYAPYLEERVFWGFDRGVHVRAMDLSHGQPGVGETVLAGERKWVVEGVVSGVDFGWNTFVCLWMVMLRSAEGERGVWVVDEYVGAQRTLEQHVGAIKHRPVRKAEGDAWKPTAVHCDVAGGQHDAHSGMTSLAVLRKAGFVVRASAMRIEEGIEAVNAMMGSGQWSVGSGQKGDDAVTGGRGDAGRGEWRNVNDEGRSAKGEGIGKLEWGSASMGGTGLSADKPVAPGDLKLTGARFFVSPVCVRLIAALEGYRREWNGRAVKDGEHDHLIDALRYGIGNIGGKGGMAVGTY